MQTAGYFLVFPGLMALVLPWRTVTHVRWLLAYTAIAITFFAFDRGATFTAAERGDLVVVLFVALGASLAGHVLLQASQIRGFAQLERIRGLQRRAAADMVELERVHHALELTARTDPLTGRAIAAGWRRISGPFEPTSAARASPMAWPRSTSTGSRRSTTSKATLPATRSSVAWSTGSSEHCAPTTRSIDSVARSSL